MTNKNTIDKYDFANIIRESYTKHGNNSWVTIATDVLAYLDAQSINKYPSIDELLAEKIDSIGRLNLQQQSIDASAFTKGFDNATQFFHKFYSSHEMIAKCKHCGNVLCDAQKFNSQCFGCGKTPY